MYLGIDIGGTSIKLGIVDEHFTVITDTAVPTATASDAIIRDVIAAARPLCEQYHPAAVGIGSAGRIDPVNGVVLRAGHLPFRNEPLAHIFEDALALPTVLENDANCALIAEAAAGVCTDCRDVLMFTIGTGIGGAIMINKHIYRAHNFRAGEMGHFIIDRKGAPCPCGLHGCFEQYASATALTAAAETAALAHPDSLLARYGKESMNGKAVFAAADDGCPVASDVLDDYGRCVAMGLNSMCKIFMPECMVLAGGIAKAGDALLSRLTPHLLPEVQLRISSLGGHAGIIGAAVCAARHQKEDS